MGVFNYYSKNIVNREIKKRYIAWREKNVGGRRYIPVQRIYVWKEGKEETYIPGEKNVETNEQTSINNSAIIDALYVKVKQIISKYKRKGSRKIPCYDLHLFLLLLQPPIKAVIFTCLLFIRTHDYNKSIYK